MTPSADAGNGCEIVHGTALVRAPLQRLWALSTRIELVKNTLGMNLAGGQISGFVRAGTRVVWKGWKFGLPTEHHTLITGFAAPHPVMGTAVPLNLKAEFTRQPVAWFQDRQEKGRFAYFQHDHWLRERVDAAGEHATFLEDEVLFRLPLGFAGRLAAQWILKPYIRRLVQRRFASLRDLAEGEGWQQWTTA